MDDDTDGKEELLRVILETEKTHAAGQKEASEIVELMQAGRERARIVRDLIPHIPAENRKQLTTAWQRENDAARAITHEIRELRTGYAVSFNSSVMATSTAALSISVSLPISPPPTPAVSNALAQLNLLMGREKLLEKVRDGLVRC